MILVNRLISFPLVIVLLALLMVSLILVRVSDTLLDPEYYLLELNKADIYEFVLVDLLTSGLEEAIELSSDRFSNDINENPSIMSGLSSDSIVVAINRTVPPEWVREQIESALEFYRMDNSRYPTTQQGLISLVTKPTSDPEPRNYPPGGYLKRSDSIEDPGGSVFRYESPGQHNQHSFDLWSLGADQSEGGEDLDGDIGNWDAETNQSG